MKDYTETYSYIDPTGVFATKIRQQLNETYSLAQTHYPHAWHVSLDTLKGNEKVLCLGIDTSLYASGLAGKIIDSGKIYLVDFNPARMLENRNKFIDDSRFEFFENLIWDVPFADDFFDVVICTYTLHRIGKSIKPDSSSVQMANEKIEKTLSQIYRVLKSNGLCLIATHAKNSFSEILNLYWKVTKELGLHKQAIAKFIHFDGFPQEDAFRILNYYFDDVKFDPIDTSLEFKEIQPFMQYWDCFPFPAFGESDITLEIRQEIRKRVINYAQKYLLETGKLLISKPSGMFLCKKRV